MHTVPDRAPPLWLLAELTYRRPRHCPFCDDPLDYADNRTELSTEQWIDVMRQARGLGAARLGFSGGEPLLRDDLEDLVGAGRRLGFYTSLITSGIGLTESRLARMKDLGLDRIHLSFQDAAREMNDFLSSTKTFDRTARVARLIKQYDYPVVLNVVPHRCNPDDVERIIDMALEMGVEYLELANTQYDGWGPVCLGIAPDGTARPCDAARTLPDIAFPNVRDASVRDIWYARDVCGCRACAPAGDATTAEPVWQPAQKIVFRSAANARKAEIA